MDPLDYGGLFDGTDGDARSQALALAQAIKMRRDLGALGTILGGPFEGAGKQFSGEANSQEKLLESAMQHRAVFDNQRAMKQLAIDSATHNQALKGLGTDKLTLKSLASGGQVWQNPADWSVYEVGPRGEVGRMLSPPKPSAPAPSPGPVTPEIGRLTSPTQAPVPTPASGVGPAPVAGSPPVAPKLLAPAKTKDSSQFAPRNPAEQIAQDIVTGKADPTMIPRGNSGMVIRDAIGKMGGDHAALVQDWNATKRHMSSLNSPQQIRLTQSINSAGEMIDNIEKQYAEWNKLGMATRFPIFNRAALATAKNLPGREGEVARSLELNIADLTSDLGNIYMGGNSPTEHALKLAHTNLQADWNPGQFEEAIKQVRKNVLFRKNALGSTVPAGASPANPYFKGGQGEGEVKAAPAVDPKDAEAKAWLDANPTHPMAEKVRAKLKSKGL
jgi:hypothetical protein